MSQERKTKLADIARQNNTAKAARFSANMIPAPPPARNPASPVEIAVEQVQEPEQLIEKGGGDNPEQVITTVNPLPVEPVQAQELVTANTEPVPLGAKPVRTRRSTGLNIEDVINAEPPKGEPYARQVRISETHHRLLRKLAFHHDKTMNHLLYNLLELLDQADQRSQQKGD